MKKIVFVFFVLMFASSSIVFSQEWETIQLNPQDNLKKILILDDCAMIFSNDHCHILSNNLNSWEEKNIPTCLTPTPVLFNGSVYINTVSGLYRSADIGDSWSLVNTENLASITANDKCLFTFPVVPDILGSVSEDGINFVTMDSLVGSFPVGYDTTFPMFRFSAAFGDTITIGGYFEGESSSKIYKSYDNGKSWSLPPDYTAGDLPVDMAQGPNSCVESVVVRLGGGEDYFIAHGCYEMGGTCGYFTATDYFDGDMWFSGIFTSSGGMVVKGPYMINMTIFSRPINALRSTKWSLIAVSNNGLVRLHRPYNNIAEYDEKIKNSYPNPTKGMATVRSLVSGEDYYVYSFDGRMIIHFKANDNQKVIDLSSYPAGVYILKGENKKEKIVKL